MEMSPLEDAPTKVPFASRADVETTQDQWVPKEIWAQENAQTSTKPVEIQGFQSSPVPPVKNENRDKHGRIWWFTRLVY